jgi:hypothetical protein
MERDFIYWLSGQDLADLKTLRDEGASAGIPGMMYYHETSRLYEKFQGDIWDAVTDYCANEGFSLGEILSNIVGGDCQSHSQFACNLVWFAAEYYVEQAILDVERDLKEEAEKEVAEED